MTMNYGHDIPAQELIDWQTSIFEQDRPVLESQRPKCLPLDPMAEMSVLPDKTAINYRRWLRNQGMTFGVELLPFSVQTLRPYTLEIGSFLDIRAHV